MNKDTKIMIIKTPKLKRHYIISIVVIMLVTSFVILKFPSSARAACSIPTTTYGTDTMTAAVPSTTTYSVWVRMKIPAITSNTIKLQVDGSNCYDVGGNSSMPVNTWTWVNYQNAVTTQTMTASLSSGNHSLELIGTQPGVIIDNILLLADNSCVPTGTGVNCTTGQPVVLPSTPAGLNSSAKSSTSVGLTWNASNDNGGPGIAGYYILRSTGGGAYTRVNSSNINSFTDTNLQPNTTYSYTVEAYDISNPVNVSISSAPTTVTTPKTPDTTPPSQPTNLGALPVGNGQISLHWTASTDNVGLVAYVLYRNGSGLAFVSPTATSYIDSSVSGNTIYSYYIVAYDTTGNKSTNSTTASTTTTAVINPAVTYVYGTVTDSVTKAPIAGVTVSVGLAGSTTTNASGQYLLSNIKPNHNYNYNFKTPNDKTLHNPEQYSAGIHQLNVTMSSK